MPLYMGCRGYCKRIDPHLVPEDCTSVPDFPMPDKPKMQEPIQGELSVLQEAEKIINGNRRDDYGSASVSFERIAGMFSAYLGISISSHDVAMLMVLLKVARSKQGIMSNGEPQRDSLVDIAGYAGCSEKVSRGQ